MSINACVLVVHYSEIGNENYGGGSFTYHLPKSIYEKLSKDLLYKVITTTCMGRYKIRRIDFLRHEISSYNTAFDPKLGFADIRNLYIHYMPFMNIPS